VTHHFPRASASLSAAFACRAEIALRLGGLRVSKAPRLRTSWFKSNLRSLRSKPFVLSLTALALFSFVFRPSALPHSVSGEKRRQKLRNSLQ
jgi:hypothetical protein